MGSSNSRLDSRPSRPRVNRMKRRVSSFFCGGSTSHAPIEMDDYPSQLLANSLENCDPVIIEELQSSVKKSSSVINSETECSSSKAENGASSASSNGPIEDASVEYGSRNVETSTYGKHLSESKELVPYQVDANCSPIDGASDVGSSSKEQKSLESVSLNVGATLNAVTRVDDSKNEGGSQTSPEGICSSSSSHQELEDSSANVLSDVENHTDEVLGVHNSDTDSLPVVSDTPVSSQSLGDESAQEAVHPAPGFLIPDRQQDRRNGGVLHIDVVSISSNFLSSSSSEISNREARRNSGRLFWDAFSRRSSRRRSDSPTIVFSTEDLDGLGSHGRWLLGVSDDPFEDGFGSDLGYLGSRGHGMFDRRRNSRSEIWERLRGQTTFCASGLHPDGHCSCERFLMTEESGSTRASISRIVMLAETLFEVLDEIHRQPASFPLSMVSVPAPESVVNSFPVKSHSKINTVESGNDVEQCYICLVEYEENDQIRVLPCQHEYHMTCVDKWLKEIHRVCPLCRGDVCEGIAEGSVSN